TPWLPQTRTTDSGPIAERSAPGPVSENLSRCSKIGAGRYENCRPSCLAGRELQEEWHVVVAHRITPEPGLAWHHRPTTRCWYASGAGGRTGDDVDRGPTVRRAIR